MTVTDFPDWGVSQDQANKISTTGVPLLTKSTLVVNSATQVIAASGNLVLGPFAVTQIGYEIFLAVLANAASTQSIGAVVDMLWTDVTTGQTVGHEIWSLANGSAGTGANYIGTGPTKGGMLTITITNQDNINALTMTTVLAQNSRVYARDDWRTENQNTNTVFASPSRNAQGNVLGAFNANINNGAAQTRLLSLYAGRVTWDLVPPVQPCLIVFATLDPKLAVQQPIAQFNITSATGQQGQLSLPRAACIITVTNNGGAAGVFSWTVVIDEYQT